MQRAFPRSPILILAILLGLLVTSLTVSAQPAPPEVQATCPYVLKSGIPFAWLRIGPSSFAAHTITMQPGDTVTVNDPPTLGWDGTQWWVYVWPNFSSGRGYYWVELNSVEARCVSATPTHTPVPGTGAAPWQAGNTVRVRSTVPFVWFRAAPAPGNPPVHTVLPGTQLAIVQGSPVQDTFAQWWWLMRDTRNGFTGWVEQNVVELVSGPGPSPVTPVPPGGWVVGDTVRVKLSVPFSWLRQAPSSISGFTATARPGQYLITLQGPLNDGVQNWWEVFIPSTNGRGWVEENSLEFVRRGS